MNPNSSITEKIKEYALNLGFDLVGIAPVEDYIEGEYFLDWLSDGHAGNMNYLERNSEKRVNPEKVLPNAKSIISCAFNYNSDKPYSTDLNDPQKGWIARYAWGDDYHDVLLHKLNELKDYFISLCDSDLGVKAYVDTGPVLEKVYSQYAGLGWIGKNSCLINQKIGSWLLLGELITDIQLDYNKKAVDRCGTCTRCIDACPTDAIVKPYVIDSRKCISYLTIELKDEIPTDLRDGIDNNIFGCDICQDVCPWNRKAPTKNNENFSPREQLFNPDLEYLAELSQEEFSKLFKGSPIKRTKRRGLIRNTLVAIGNSGNKSFVPVVKKLMNDEEPLIRLHAVWALWKIEGEKSLSKIVELKKSEKDKEVIKEINYIVNILHN